MTLRSCGDFEDDIVLCVFGKSFLFYLLYVFLRTFEMKSESTSGLYAIIISTEVLINFYIKEYVKLISIEVLINFYIRNT